MTVEQKAEEGLNKRLGTMGYLNKQNVARPYTDGFIDGYKKANEWQTGEPIKGREIFARNIANCNLLATYFDGAWRNVWNGGIIDFDKIIMWRYTGFKNNGEEIEFSKESE